MESKQKACKKRKNQANSIWDMTRSAAGTFLAEWWSVLYMGRCTWGTPDCKQPQSIYSKNGHCKKKKSKGIVTYGPQLTIHNTVKSLTYPHNWHMLINTSIRRTEGGQRTFFNPNCNGQGQIWQNFYVSDSCRNVFQIFFNFWHDIKKWCFDIHFGVFLSEVRLRFLLTPPLPLGCNAITDHARVGEVLPGCGPQLSLAPVRIPNSFWSQAEPSVRGGGGSQSGLLSCSF